MEPLGQAGPGVAEMRAVVGARILTNPGGCGNIIDAHAVVDRLVFGVDGKDSHKGGGGGCRSLQ